MRTIDDETFAALCQIAGAFPIQVEQALTESLSEKLKAGAMFPDEHEVTLATDIGTLRKIKAYCLKELNNESNSQDGIQQGA